MDKNRKKPQVWLPLLLSAAMFVGIFMGYRLRGNMPAPTAVPEYDGPLPLSEVMELVRSRYVDELDMDSLGQASIEQLFRGLDPHSMYISAKELQSMNEDLAGHFEGVGIEFNIIDDTVHVISVVKDGPSEKAGLQSGDRLLKVGDSAVAVKGISNDRIRSMLRGPGGSKVDVTVLRDTVRRRFAITRGVIPLHSVDAAYMLKPSVGYIRLNKFSEETYEEFMGSLEALQAKGMEALVLDLRDNGGGILEEAVEMADEFIDADKRIVYTEGRHSPRKEYRGRRNGLFEEGKLVLLLDEGSASASEVLAGALQDWERATIIGRQSFGKGLVQEQYALSDGSAVRLTVARYFTPLGRSIQRSYSDGTDSYHAEIISRLINRGIPKADSTKSDSAKAYRTASGKILYEGGGISPDILVPIEEYSNDEPVIGLFRENTVERFAYRYCLANGPALARFKTPQAFNEGFSLNDGDLAALYALGIKEGVKVGKPSPKTKESTKLRVKALIARQLWRTEGYFVVMNGRDGMIEEALKHLGKAD